jgi:hypothetical protein
MYLTLLATYFLYNTTTKGTYTGTHGGCCAARGTHDAVPGDEQSRRRRQCCQRGDLARPAGSVCRSRHRGADGYEHRWPTGVCLDLGAAMRLLAGCLLPFDRTRGEARNSVGGGRGMGGVGVYVIIRAQERGGYRTWLKLSYVAGEAAMAG